MNRNRLINLNVFYYLKDCVLPQNGYIYSETSFTLTQEAAGSLQFNSDIPNWFYNDLVSYPVHVYDNGSLVSSADYTVNFVGGFITFDSAPTGPITADFSYDVYKFTLSWPEEDLTRDKLPLIVLDLVDYNFSGLQVGGGRIYAYSFAMHVFENSDEEAQDVVDAILNKFTHYLPVIDFNQGTPLNNDGTLNSFYSSTGQYLGQAEILIESMSSVRLTDPVDREEHRFAIYFSVQDISYPGMPATI